MRLCCTENMLQKNSVVYYVSNEITKFKKKYSYDKPNLTIENAPEWFLSSSVEPVSPKQPSRKKSE